MPACHAGGRGFESLPGRQFNTLCWCGSTVEQLTCNQQVVGSIPITSSNVEDFPSGQRGQTVNLLALLSVVRIHHPPPTIYKVKCGCGGIGRRTRLRIWRLRRGGSTPFIRTTLLIQCGNSSVVERNLAKVEVASSNLVSRSTIVGA